MGYLVCAAAKTNKKERIPMRCRFFIAGFLALGASAVAHAHPAADWTDVLVECDSASAPPFARSAAILHVAMFDAANAVEKRFRPYRPSPAFTTPASA